MLFIGSIRERLSIIALSGEEYADALHVSSGRGIVGGGIYDALLATFRRKIGISDRPRRFPWLFGDAPVVLSDSRARRREAGCPGSMSGSPEHFPC